MEGCPHCQCNLPTEKPNLLEEIMEFAEIANTAASLLAGHRAILIDGGIDPAVVDQMVYNLHSKILGTRSYDDFVDVVEGYEE